MIRFAASRLLIFCAAVLFSAAMCSAAGKADPAAGVRAKLRLLDKAHQAGLFTDKEYAKKRAALEAQLQALKPRRPAAVAEKLKTLEAAHKVGLLTDKEYARKKAQLLREAAEAAASARKPPKATPKPKAVALTLPPKLAKAQTYRHPTGFTFQYPADWKLHDTGEGVQLTPPDVQTGPRGPTEKYLVVAQTVPDASRVDDPWVVRFYENQIRAVAPFLVRRADTEPALTVSGPGVVAIWEGKAPSGALFQARAYITVLKGFGVVLAGLGEKKRLTAREGTLRQIFASFRMGEVEKDPKLLGTWRANLLKPGSLTGVARTLILRADGTFFISSAAGAAPGATPALDDDRPGRWGTADGKLHIAWPSGFDESFTYELKGAPGTRSLLLKGAGGREVIWREVR